MYRFLTFVLSLFLLAPAATAQTPLEPDSPRRQSHAATRANSTQLSVQLHATSDGVQITTDANDVHLTISGPDRYHQQLELHHGQGSWSAFDTDGQLRPDGVYFYELRAFGSQGANLVQHGHLQRGHFRLQGGNVLLPLAQPEADPDKDQVFADDLIAERVCAGPDCGDGETFGFTVLRLHSFNNHIDFVDSSGVNYATRDWRLEVNDTSYGGSDRFAVRDVDADTQPFGMAGGAPDYSLWIDGNGQLGLGTSTPAERLHLVDSLPTLRLDQPVNGFLPEQKWDLQVSGLGNLEINDVTGGAIPFRIYDGAPSYSLVIDSNGQLGLGTSTPAERLHLVDSLPTLRLDQPANGGLPAQQWDLQVDGFGNLEINDVTSGTIPFQIADGAADGSFSIDGSGNVGIGVQDATTDLHLVRSGQVQLRMQDTSGGDYWTLEAGNGPNFALYYQQQASTMLLNSNGTVRFGPNGSSSFLLAPDGDLEIAGTLTQNSDVHSKTGFEAVDARTILEQVAALPITTWTFKNDTQQARHMGPMAQDFHATFGLGERPDRLAPVDVDGVTLAAVQALYEQLQKQKAQIDAMQAENVELRQRLERLEQP